MKTILLLIALAFGLKGYSQAAVIHISSEQIKQLKSFRDLLPGVPADCKLKSCILSASINGSYKEFTITLLDTDLSDQAHKWLSTFSKGQSFFLEKFNTSCPAFFKSKSYHFIVD